MTIITEVRFAHDDGALADTLTALPDLEVTVVSETSTDPDRNVSHLRFEYVDPATLREELAGDHTVSDAEPVREFETGRLWAVEFAPKAKLLAPRVTNEGGFVLDARSASGPASPRGWHERWLLPGRDALHTIWQDANEAGFEFDILEFHRRGRTDAAYPGGDALTEEQREALVAAYERGYFTEPRETSLEELAAEFDLSASAVGGRIKRGMKALIGGALVVDESERT